MMTHQNIADMLADEAEHAEQHRDDELTHGYRRAHPPREPAQVYSLRIPVGQLDELRRLAADRHLTPSALMRSWVLDRLDAEAGGNAEAGDARQPAVVAAALPEHVLRLVIREELERASVGTSPHHPEERRRSSQSRGRGRSAEIRAWAREHGYQVTARGKLPAEIVEDYEAAN
jgi:Lsr2